MIPPEMRKLSSEMPSASSRIWPTTRKNSSTPAATSTALIATARRCAGLRLPVRAMNTGTVPIGSITTHKVTNCSSRLVGMTG